MKKLFFYTITIITLLTVAGGKTFAQKEFTPDTTINNLFFLYDANSSEMFYPNINNIEIFDEELFSKGGTPHIIFFNADKTKYLVAFTHYGSCKNHFAEFEIGYVTEQVFNEVKNKHNETAYQDFQTESGLHLGMTLKELERVKGKNYDRKGNVVTYIMNDTISVFLNIYYNMPEYYLKCELSQNKISKIKFGFTYP